MQVSVQTTEGLERRMTVQVPAEQVDQEVANRLRDLSRNVRLDGFRPGKVPFKVVQKRFGSQVRQEVVNDVLQRSYGEALSQESLNPAGAPTVDIKNGLESGDLEYEAVFEVMPEFQVKGVQEMALERPVAEVADADVDKVLADLQKQQAKFNQVEREAQEGDRVVVDFVGKIEGEGFPGNEGEDQAVTLGSNTMPPEFEQALVGLKAGDTKDIEYTFAEDFPTESIRGKTAVFHTTVKAVEEPELPALDDDLAAAVGVAEGGLEELKNLIRNNLTAEAERASRAQLKQQVTDKLAESNSDITIPKALVDGEISALQQQMQQRIQQQTGQQEAMDLPGELFEEQARRRVLLGLVMNRLISDNELKLDRERVQLQLQELAASYPNPQEVVQYYSQNQQLMQSLEINVLEDQVIDWVVEQADVEDKPTDLDTLLKPQQPQGASGGDEEQTGKNED